MTDNTRDAAVRAVLEDAENRGKGWPHLPSVSPWVARIEAVDALLAAGWQLVPPTSAEPGYSEDQLLPSVGGLVWWRQSETDSWVPGTLICTDHQGAHIRDEDGVEHRLGLRVTKRSGHGGTDE